MNMKPKYGKYTNSIDYAKLRFLLTTLANGYFCFILFDKGEGLL